MVVNEKIVNEYKNYGVALLRNVLSDNWLEKLDSDEQATAQQIVDHFFKIVRCQKVDIPKIEQVRFWAISILVQHFDYFAKDNAIDPTIHHLFLEIH